MEEWLPHQSIANPACYGRFRFVEEVFATGIEDRIPRSPDRRKFRLTGKHGSYGEDSSKFRLPVSSAAQTLGTLIPKGGHQWLSIRKRERSLNLPEIQPMMKRLSLSPKDFAICRRRSKRKYATSKATCMQSRIA